MRGYTNLNDVRLSRSGSNLSAILFHLWGDPAIEPDAEHRQNRADLLDFIQSLPEQQITELGFIKTERNDVMLKLKETFGGKDKWCDAVLLSDGTLRVLAIAAALLSAKEGSLVVIEEIDNGVHPSRAAHLMQKMSEIAKRRKLKVLLTTHNEALANAIPTEFVEQTVFCYRDPESGCSRLVRLADVPYVLELLLQGNVGTLLTKGKLDHFIKNPLSTEQRKERRLKWLETLKQTEVS